MNFWSKNVKQNLFFLNLKKYKDTFTGIEAATFYCPDPLNIQANRGDATPTPASTSAAGVVTCGSGLTTPGCGVKKLKKKRVLFRRNFEFYF